MRVWFNHWFSTVYHLINLMKESDPGRFYIIGSNANSLSVYKSACDEWYREPADLPAEEYVRYCLDFCVEHRVDVFVPRKHLVAISKNRHLFEALSVKVLVDADADTVAMLDDKCATYAFFRDICPECVPEVRIARSYEEFLAGYEELQSLCPRVCYKLIEDEGARSFRVIDDRIESIKGLFEKPGAKITLSAAKNVLSQYDFSIPVLLMPYLSGVEVSVDCLATPSGNLIIPRYKTNKRYSEIIFKPELMATCSRMMDALGLNMPMNIQFKVEDGCYYLLEINPRMSGGLQLSCKAADINLPGIAIHQLLGTESEWHYPEFESRKVVHIETPICFD